MTQQLKYKTPIPIKAQKGTKVKYVSPRAQKAKQSNARNKAISEQYFNQSPSIQNLAKGAYYWLKSQPALLGEDESDVITGTAPIAGSVASSIPSTINRVKQALPSVAAVASFMGGRSGAKEIPSAQGISRTKSVPYYRAEAAQDSTQTAPPVEPSENTQSQETPQQEPSQPKNPGQKNKNNNSKIKQETKKVFSNIGKGYGIVLKGGAYGTGFVGIPGGIGYGIYSMFKPKPTAADSLIEQQSRQLIELNKLNQAKQNQQKIDALRKQLNSQTVAQPDSTRVIQQKPSTPVTTSTQEQLDSINATWGNDF